MHRVFLQTANSTCKGLRRKSFLVKKGFRCIRLFLCKTWFCANHGCVSRNFIWTIAWIRKPGFWEKGIYRVLGVRATQQTGGKHSRKIWKNTEITTTCPKPSTCWANRGQSWAQHIVAGEGKLFENKRLGRKNIQAVFAALRFNTRCLLDVHCFCLRTAGFPPHEPDPFSTKQLTHILVRSHVTVWTLCNTIPHACALFVICTFLRIFVTVCWVFCGQSLPAFLRRTCIYVWKIITTKTPHDLAGNLWNKRAA